MNYYQFHIGDFNNATRHLDRLERSIYRDLIDLYYDKELPLPNDIPQIARKIAARDHEDIVESILIEFFTLDGMEWKNRRCDADIAKYQEKSDKAKASANARWNANASSKDANAMRTHTECNANHKPITNNHKPIPQGINPASWGEFEKHRKEIRKPLSELARTKAMNVIIDMSFDDQAKVIDKTIQNRWTGLFPEKGNGTDKSLHESNHSRVVRQLAEKIRDE